MTDPVKLESDCNPDPAVDRHQPADWMPALAQHTHAGAGSSVTQVGRDLVNYYGKVLRNISLDTSLNSIRECFAPVDPAQWGRLVSVWRAGRLTVITGRPHVGKRSAALRLLSQVEAGTDIADLHDLPVRELVADWEAPDSGMLPRQVPGAYLLDLGEVAADQFPARFGRDLASYIDDESRVRLVVTMTREAWERCGAEAGDVEAPLTAPIAKQVVLSHLRRVAGDRVSWAGHRTLEELITDQTLPRDAVRLAAAIGHAPEELAASADDDVPAEQSGGPSDAAVSHVVDEYRAWRTFLRGFFGSNAGNTVEDRALLISAALLAGAAPAVIWEAAMQLLKGRLVPSRASDLLAGEDMDTQLARITGAEVTELPNGVSLDSVRHGLSASVLPHVWRQRPQMKDVLLEWIRSVSAVKGAGHAELPVIGRRLGELAIAVEDFDVVDTVWSWVDGSADRQVLVARLLADIAEQDATIAAVLRSKMWAVAYAYRDKNTSAVTAELVARVCSSRFMRGYPNACLVRLKWLLAGPWSPVIGSAATEVLRRMAGEDIDGVFRAVHDWRSDSALAASRGFLMLIDPDGEAPAFRRIVTRAAQDDRADSLLRQGWEQAAAQPELEEHVAAVFRRWAESADRDDEIAAPTLNILAWLIRRTARGSLADMVFGAGEERGGMTSTAVNRVLVAMLRHGAG
ncbi:hypothetical protein ACWEF6_06895 [Amycolatopsis sp. NPDC004772]